MPEVYPKCGPSHNSESLITVDRRLAIYKVDDLHLKETIDILFELGTATETTGSNGTPPISKVDMLMQTRAMAATVWIYFRIMHMNGYGTIADNSFKGVLDSSFAVPMFKLTETCILLGFIPPAILHVIGWLKTLPQRFGRDIREAASVMRSKATWTKYEEYERDQRSEERQRLAKISQTPNRYRCAADGCGIQAFHKGALRRCGGRCPTHKKPHYCSAYCQRKVRDIHANLCTRTELRAELP